MRSSEKPPRSSLASRWILESWPRAFSPTICCILEQTSCFRLRGLQTPALPVDEEVAGVAAEEDEVVEAVVEEAAEEEVAGVVAEAGVVEDSEEDSEEEAEAEGVEAGEEAEADTRVIMTSKDTVTTQSLSLRRTLLHAQTYMHIYLF
mmetsp:Transcript_676/g.1544  ORF Transcript_676/g.1544 Transcript_676/m.1544 type:complete len:148 (-) Transcript_676:20-463(-)